MYANFASIYDRLMQDIPYSRWHKYINKLFKMFGHTPKVMLDLGCGTGNIAIPFAKAGVKVYALDLSAEMLALAEQKARCQGLEITLINQDMRKINLGHQVDTVVSLCDSLNYITDLGELEQVFLGVGQQLESGGLFVFDLNSMYKIRQVFGSNTYTFQEEDVAYIWDNYLSKHTVTMELTFFVKDEQTGQYRKFSETHKERGYTVAQIRKLLRRTGFTPLGCFGELAFTQPVGDTERIYWVARKN